MAPVQVPQAGELRDLVVPQEPRAAVDLGGQNQAAVEGLEHEVVLPEVQAGGQAHAVVLDQAIHARHEAPIERPGAVMDGGPRVAVEDVDVGLGALPQRGGGVGLGRAQVDPLVQHQEVGAVTAALRQGSGEDLLLLGPQAAGHPVELEHQEVVVAAQIDQHVGARALLLGGLAEAVGPQPDAQAAAEGGGLLHQRCEAARKLLPELPRVEGPAVVGDQPPDARRVGPVIHVAHVQGVDVELHAVLVVEPGPELQVDQRLGLGRALVLAVDPVEVVRARRGPLVGPGEDLLRGGRLGDPERREQDREAGRGTMPAHEAPSY